MNRIRHFSSLFLCVVLCTTAFSLYSQTSIQSQEIKSINREIKVLPCEPGAITMIDGPIELRKWYNPKERKYKSEYRILFMLREAWGDTAESDDLTEIRRGESSMPSEGSNTYLPMVKIANMLVKGASFYQIEANSFDAYALFKECSAIVEVKKYYGATQSNRSEIRSHALKNLDLLTRQINTYDPNIVILGVNDWLDGIAIKEEIGGYRIFGEFIPVSHTGKIPSSNKLMFYYTKNRIYLKVYHPGQYTITKEKYCTEIIDAIKKWESWRDK